jgi:hypothetical protein
MVRRVRRKIAPAFEIVSEKIIWLIGRNDVGVAGVNQRESAPCRANIHRLPKPVEHQNLTVQRGLQCVSFCRFVPATPRAIAEIRASLSSAFFIVNMSAMGRVELNAAHEGIQLVDLASVYNVETWLVKVQLET